MSPASLAPPSARREVTVTCGAGLREKAGRAHADRTGARR